ncbi:MAG: hypothetical protein NZM04_05365 [Methylacidiphilales bacterium]|nr:hypothetical protein [Candidatus Methylacidiphilales bacterium]
MATASDASAQSACQVRNPWPTRSSAPVNVPWLPPSHRSQPMTILLSSLRAVTFVGSKKMRRSHHAGRASDALRDVLVDTLSRDEAVLQAVVDQGPRAFQSCNDGFSGYAALDYRDGCL